MRIQPVTSPIKASTAPTVVQTSPPQNAVADPAKLAAISHNEKLSVLQHVLQAICSEKKHLRPFTSAHKDQIRFVSRAVITNMANSPPSNVEQLIHYIQLTARKSTALKNLSLDKINTNKFAAELAKRSTLAQLTSLPQ
jgi:hypothetical protein